MSRGLIRTYLSMPHGREADFAAWAEQKSGQSA